MASDQYSRAALVLTKTTLWTSVTATHSWDTAQTGGHGGHAVPSLCALHSNMLPGHPSLICRKVLLRALVFSGTHGLHRIPALGMEAAAQTHTRSVVMTAHV